MRILVMLILAIISISLTACSSMSGNVIPRKGPTMEQIYDSMGKQQSANSSGDQADLTQVRKEARKAVRTSSTSLPASVSMNSVQRNFRKLPNPELQMYIYPHVAGQDQVPIPGYSTAFDAYQHNYYALPDETPRG